MCLEIGRGSGDRNSAGEALARVEVCVSYLSKIDMLGDERGLVVEGDLRQAGGFVGGWEASGISDESEVLWGGEAGEGFDLGGLFHVERSGCGWMWARGVWESGNVAGMAWMEMDLCWDGLNECWGVRGTRELGSGIGRVC